ncbi:MAG: hypothetical protein ACTSRG_11305 [Candidatus Helarchaeota archaeon]
MEEFDLSLRGTAKVLFTKEIGTLIVKMIYPSVLTYCYENLGKEKAISILYKLGSDIMDDFLKFYNKENESFQDYIKDYLMIFYNSKAKIKKIEENLYHVIDEKCILCQDIVLEGLPFHYCVPYAGSIGRMLDVLVEQDKIPKFKYKVKTISSKGSGDPSCIHAITIEK